MPTARHYPVFTAVSGLVICPLTAGGKEIEPLLTVEI